MARVGFQPTPCRSQSRRSNHSTTLPTRSEKVKPPSAVRVSRAKLSTECVLEEKLRALLAVQTHVLLFSLATAINFFMEQET